MRELPILMNGAMVRAVLDGRKTVTRRAVKGIALDWLAPGMFSPEYTASPENRLCPYGNVGDRLYVRETAVREPHPSDIGLTREDIPHTWDEVCANTGKVTYRADLSERVAEIFIDGRRWVPSIHMPRAWARIWLEVTAVSVERLQDITEEQAKAEGCFFTDYGRECGHTGFGWTDVGGCPGHESTHPQRAGWMWDKTTSHEECLHSARFAFGNLWNATGADWDANPWVWVVEFKRIETEVPNGPVPNP